MAPEKTTSSRRPKIATPTRRCNREKWHVRMPKKVTPINCLMLRIKKIKHPFKVVQRSFSNRSHNKKSSNKSNRKKMFRWAEKICII